MTTSSYIDAGTLATLRAKGHVLVSGADRPLVVFYNDGEPVAVDNRCPHLGFPLHKGNLTDGLLTCEWHHARFDAKSGCTFDLWADDIPAFDVKLEGERVLVSTAPRQPEDTDFHLARLQKGLRRNIGLVIAKSIIGLLRLETPPAEIIARIATHGSLWSESFGQGLTQLTIVANLAPALDEDTLYYALTQAASEVARNCANATPRKESAPLTGAEHEAATLKTWFRHWLRNRHRDGAERCLLSAIEQGQTIPELTDLVYSAVHDRLYADTGHLADLTNKAFELADQVGEHALPDLLPLRLGAMANSRGREENAAWQHPVPIAKALLDMDLAEPPYGHHPAPPALRDILLGNDPLAIIETLRQALVDGVEPVALAREVSAAAAWRLAHFATSNDTGDWFNPVHTYTYANAISATVARAPTPDVLRGIFHGAISVYMDRQVNVPPARLPLADKDLDGLPTDADELLGRILGALDGISAYQQLTAWLVRYLRLGHDRDTLIDRLAFATVREDLDFHYLQVLEAGYQQAGHWGTAPEAELHLIAILRYLSAFCPTPRAGHRTATIALKLHRGEAIHE